MASFGVDFKVQFYQGMFDRYRESTKYTSTVDVFGDVVTTSSTDYNFAGCEIRTKYTVDGTLSFSTNETIKYIYVDLLLCNRVGDVIGTEKYSFMGPFNGDGALDLHRIFGEGLKGSDIPYVKVKAVRCEFMDGSYGEAEFDICETVEVLKLETQKDRNAQEEGSKGLIIFINLFFSPIGGIIYTLYRQIKGYKKEVKLYWKITLIILPIYILLFLLMNYQ